MKASPPINRLQSPVVPLTIAAGFFMEGLDSTILNTAIPSAARSLHTSALSLSLAVTSYLLTLAVFIPISGWLADRWGGRRIFCSAIIVFTLGSVLCGASTTLTMLVGGRIVQGMGGAMMTPVGRLILARTFPKDQLIVATSYMALPGLVGPLLGPVVGGFLTTYFSWHWIFLINVPVGLVGLAFSLRFIPATLTDHPGRFDFFGFAQVSLGLTCAQLALEFGGRGMLARSIETALVVGALLLALGYWRYARGRSNAVIDLELFRIRPFAVSVFAGGIARLGILAAPFMLPLLFQIGYGMDPFHSGLLVCLASLGALFTRVGAPTLLRTYGIRTVLIVNAVLLALLLGGFGLFGPHTPVAVLAVYIFVFGLARTAQFSALSALSLDVPPHKMSKGTSVAAVAQRLSQSVGVAIAAALMASVSGGDKRPTLDGFVVVFVVMAVLSASSVIGFMRLSPTDGQALSGHRR